MYYRQIIDKLIIGLYFDIAFSEFSLTDSDKGKGCLVNSKFSEPKFQKSWELNLYCEQFLISNMIDIHNLDTKFLFNDPDIGDRYDVRRAAAIEDEIKRAFEGITAPENSLQAFKRLTNQQPWLPFCIENPSAEEAEELEVFDELERKHGFKICLVRR